MVAATGGRGAAITFVNRQRMVLPLTYRVTFADGKNVFTSEGGE